MQRETGGAGEAACKEELATAFGGMRMTSSPGVHFVPIDMIDFFFLGLIGCLPI